MELVKKRKVDKETNAQTSMPSKMRCRMNTWQDYISHEIDVSKELDADFNIPKIDLISHCVEQIRQYGDLRQYSPERHERAHKSNLKEVWNASITISTTRRKLSPFSVTFWASKSDCSISKPLLCIEGTALPPAMSPLPVLIWMPPRASSHMRSPNSWDPKTAVMESILML
jgi:hypothetical protein